MFVTVFYILLGPTWRAEVTTNANTNKYEHGYEYEYGYGYWPEFGIRKNNRRLTGCKHVKNSNLERSFKCRLGTWAEILMSAGCRRGLA